MSAPAKGCKIELTRPNIEISKPTRTVSGNGIQGAGNLETKMGKIIKSMLFPIASPKRAAESATTTLFPPIRSSLSKSIIILYLKIFYYPITYLFDHYSTAPVLECLRKPYPDLLSVLPAIKRLGEHSYSVESQNPLRLKPSQKVPDKTEMTMRASWYNFAPTKYFPASLCRGQLKNQAMR
jgi:hypothetical protein